MQSHNPLLEWQNTPSLVLVLGWALWEINGSNDENMIRIVFQNMEC